MRAHRGRAALLLLLMAAIASTACGRIEESPSPATPGGLYEFRGTVVSVDAGRGIVEIAHEAIPGLMPAMTMPYEVADPALLVGLSPGDRVRGTMRVDGRGYVITALQKI
jgi:Cu/Ag efflux protein CusF